MLRVAVKVAERSKIHFYYILDKSGFSDIRTIMEPEELN